MMLNGKIMFSMLGGRQNIESVADAMMDKKVIESVGAKGVGEYVDWIFEGIGINENMESDQKIRQEHWHKFMTKLSNWDKYPAVQNIGKNMLSYEKQIKVHNKNMKLLFDHSPSFFRGTGKDELDSYLETGLIGGEKNKYDFVSLSVSPDGVGQFSSGVLIEFDGDGIRNNNAKPAQYTAQRQPLQQQTKNIRREKIGDLMSGELADELEVRLPENLPIKDLGIKNIYISKWAFDKMEKVDVEKYRELGTVHYVEMIPESELGYTYKDMVTGTTMEEKGKLKEDLWNRAQSGDKDAQDELFKKSMNAESLGDEAVGPHTREYDYVINMPTTTPEINSINATGKFEDPDSVLARSRMNDNLLPQEELDKIIF